MQQHLSRRRTNAKFGYVNFPVDSPQWTNSREGGMFVKLVVVDDRDHDASPWNICCGADVFDHLSEPLVGDDRCDFPPSVSLPADATSAQAKAWLDNEQQAQRKWEERHWPALHDDGDSTHGRYVSRPYLASMLLGITGWSGANPATGELWRCQFSDLSAEGQALYRQVQALYAGCTLHLLTFLDT